MTERELFEEWAYSKKWNTFRIVDMGIDRYADDFVDGAWHGWQASSNRVGERYDDLESLVEERVEERIRGVLDDRKCEAIQALERLQDGIRQMETHLEFIAPSL